MKAYEGCRIFTSMGDALVHIYGYPDCTIKDLATALCLTHRSVWGMVGELKRAGLIQVRKEGRRHHYGIAEGATVSHPTVGGCAVRIPLKRAS